MNRLPEATEGDPVLMEAVVRHFEELCGSVEMVYHEQTSTFVHIDIHHFPADSDEDFHTFVTTGMAEKPMNVPSEVPTPENYRYAELVLHLPASWPTEWEELSKPENWWPLQTLQNLARLPHRREGWLWGGHTLRHGDDLEPYADDTQFCAALVCPSFLLPDEFETLTLADGRNIVFLTIAFIYREEFEYCVEHQSDAFFEKIRESGMSPFDFFVLNKNRPNVCA